ncbi:hypothetical protein A5733_23455 [Mycobacterium sp. NS-7484]|uniref:DUF7715 family protein n=1 Tax=Mycobacterium sp. NS-7484 TaxID=1834161 RepID=UPI00096C52BF|nr:hypothetical protein [Mycobacterium sp. NS-7484]OMC03407.1 hypothetical protein A5733_23455 [Mycobacterium sp. NS-7484]
MKVLAATRPPRPLAKADHWSATEGEIMVAPYVCDDTACGCDVVHQGITSHGYSTLAVVGEVTATPDRLIAACRIHLAASPWAEVADSSAELDILAEDLIVDMYDAAAKHPVGTQLRMMFDRGRRSWAYEPLGSSGG